MAIRINTNVAALLATLNLNHNFSKASDSIAKLSSGLRIYRAGDDPAGVQTGSLLKSDSLVWEQAARNSNEAISALQVMDDTANQIIGILTQMRNLAEESANGTITDSDRKSLQESYLNLKSTIDLIASAAEYGALQVGLGDLDGVEVQIGITNGADITLDIDKVIGGSGILTATKISQGTNLANSVVSTQTDAQQALNYIDSSIKSVSMVRGNIGAYQNALFRSSDNASNMATNLASAASTIQDVDFATEVANFTKASILTQAGMAFLSQANLLHQSVLTLVG